MKRYRWLAVWGIIAIFLCGTVLILTAEGPRRHETFKVTYGDVSNSLNLNGRVTTADSKYIYSPLAGKIAEVYVTDGQHVIEGQDLYRLDNSEIEKELTNLKAQAEEYQLNLVKQREEAAKSKVELGIMQAQNYFAEYSGMRDAVNDFLAQQKLQEAITVSGSVLGKDEQDSWIKQINEKIDDLERDIANSIITAPITGEIIFKQISEGAYVSASAPCAVIQGTELLELSVAVHENDYEDILPGQKIYVDGSPIGEIVRKSSLSSGEDGLVRGEARVRLYNQDGYIINSRVKVSVVTQEVQNVLIIPALWIQKDDAGYYVTVKNGTGEKKRYISLGTSNGRYTQVLKGLEEGEEIVSPFDL